MIKREIEKVIYSIIREAGIFMEIERKFTINCLPKNLEQYPKKELEQGYLSKAPIVRVRKTVKNGEEGYLLCYKSKLALPKAEEKTANVCEEVELMLTKEAYVHLLSKADGRVLSKTRYLIPYQSYTIELDVFHGDFEGLCFAEVEFPTQEEAEAFCVPDWFLKDVTFDKRFRNNHMATDPDAVKELADEMSSEK